MSTGAEYQDLFQKGEDRNVNWGMNILSHEGMSKRGGWHEYQG